VQLVKYTVRHGVSVMPPLRKTELSDADLDAIAAYLTRKRR
jgi:(+)-pinoresinol hydroxylase